MTISFSRDNSPAINSVRAVLENGDTALINTSKIGPFKVFSIDCHPETGATITLAYTQDAITPDAFYFAHAAGEITFDRGFREDSPYRALRVQATGGGGTIWVSGYNLSPDVTEI